MQFLCETDILVIGETPFKTSGKKRKYLKEAKFIHIFLLWIFLDTFGAVDR